MMNFIALDVETANENLSSICQIGIVAFKNGIAANKWNFLVNPEEHFSPINIDIHGINEHKVKSSPKFNQIFPELSRIISNQVVVIHSPFDKIAITRSIKKYKLNPISCSWLDTTRVVRRTWDKYLRNGYGLSNLANEFNITFDHHDAVEDARATGEILVLAIKQSCITLEDWLFYAYQPINSSGNSRVARNGNPNGPLAGEVIVFTGSMRIHRNKASELASNLGCDVDDGVNKRTTILVVGDQDLSKLAGNTKSSKHRKAEDLIKAGQDILILSESEFLRLIGID